MLLGAEEGLFSYHLNKENSKPVKIGGVGSVYQITVMSHRGIAIMISGKNRDVIFCEYAQLKSCAEAAECTQAVLSTKPVFGHGNTISADGCFQLIATSKPNESGTTADMLCAASAKRLV